MPSLKLSILLILFVLSSCARTTPEKETRPNIIFILADDLGLSDVNSFDPLSRTYYETPNIDRLARQGMKFLEAYTNAANCAPTRAAIESGQYFPNQPIYHVGDSGPGPMIPAENAHHLPLEKITSAEMLQLAGYSTGLVGKWHLGISPEHGPQNQGYDVNVGGSGEGNPGVWEGGYFEPNNNVLIDDAREGEYLTDYLTRKAIDFIEEHRETPFFLNLSYYTPHSPFQAPEELVRKYEEKDPDGGHGHATFAAMVEVLDKGVGSLMSALDQHGLSENTVVIFYSDNGGVGSYGFLGYGHRDITDNSPLRGGKGTFYEGGIRVPMIVRWPRVIAAGSTSEEPVTGVDLYPTYLEAAGVEGAEGYHLDGMSLVPLFENPEHILQRESLFWHFPGYPNNPWRTTPVSVVRSGPWKLMKFFETGEVELYNLKDDVAEKFNLAEREPDKRDQLIQQLDDWLAETNAPLPRWP